MSWASFIDYFYPTAEPLPEKTRKEEEAREQELRIAAAHPEPEKVVDAYEKIEAAEAERLKSVETRLGSVLGLTSITASLLVGGTFAMVNGSLSDSSHLVRGIAACGVLYLSVQIIVSTIAAVRGLSRASWLGTSFCSFVPKSGQSEEDHKKEQAVESCNRVLQMQRNINFKVTQMAVAHTAVRNFSFGSAFFAVLGFAVVLSQAPGGATAKAIRTNTELQNLLRGPQGPIGPRGPKEDTGVVPSAHVQRNFGRPKP